MFIRMVWGKLRAGCWEEFERHYHERVAAGVKPKGLHERQLIRSTEDPDEGISVSLWDNEEALLRYERSDVRRSMAQEVENLYRGQFWVKHFQVTDSNR